MVFGTADLVFVFDNSNVVSTWGDSLSGSFSSFSFSCAGRPWLSVHCQLLFVSSNVVFFDGIYFIISDFMYLYFC
jgi:hypothetical protein